MEVIGSVKGGQLFQGMAIYQGMVVVGESTVFTI